MRRRTFLALGSLFLLPALPVNAQRVNLPPVQKSLLPGGGQIALAEYHRAPTITVIAVFPGGTAADPKGKEGAASLMATLLKRGTKQRTATQLAEEIEFLGGSLDVGVSDDRLTVSLDVLAKDTETGLDLMADIVLNPLFPQEELDRERDLQISGLQSLSESPGTLASLVSSESVYGDHPYGRSDTITSLKAISRDDILAAYRRLVQKNGVIFVAVGDFRTPEMRDKLEKRFAVLPEGESKAAEIPTVTAGRPRLILVDKPDATQTQVIFERTALPRSTPDYIPVQVANAILGGGFTSRLIDEIRVNRSLTYGIGSGFGMQRLGGNFKVTTFTKIETTRALLDATRNVLQNTALRGFTTGELNKIKGFMAGLYAIRMQTPQALAGQVADILFYNLPADYLQTYLPSIKAVSLSQVNAIAKKYFTPDALSITLVAPAAKIESQLKGLGTFETRPVGSVGK